ncbi:MAG: hypothetical protein EBS90_10425 [Betaproteobacteria bacterium]|nr:hypothetical protein [Betaproteobacteria bacterium]
MSETQDEFAVYRAMQTIAAAVRADEKYRMEWVGNIAAVAVSAGAGASVAMEKASQFVDTLFVQMNSEERLNKVNDG